MFAEGLVAEVETLVGQGLREGVTAPRAIGYAQVLQLMDGEIDEAAAREATFVGTRRYVRRQRSWFGRDPHVHWLRGGASDLLDAALRTRGEHR